MADKTVSGPVVYLPRLYHDNGDGTYAEVVYAGGGGGGGGDASAANQTSQITQETAIAGALGTTSGAKVVTDANGTIQQYLRGLVTFFANALGAGTAATALRVTLASDSPAGSDPYAQYETVAASQTDQVLGATGGTGDYLAGVLVFPGTAGCGVVTIKDNTTTIGTFAGGGTTALPSLVPFMIPVGLFSVSGAWKITTGANVTAVGIGKFA